MKHRRSTKGIWLDIGVLVVCLAIITSCISSGMFAKFVTGSGVGKDTAKVASFNVSAKASGDPLVLADEDDAKAAYTLTLNNDSDVAVRYSITINFVEGNKADGLKVKIGSHESKVENGSARIENIGSMAPGKMNEQVVITFLRGDDFSGTEELSLDFYANVLFSQID